jgi:hypothetical protein
MRNVRYWVGFALVAAAASCGGSDKSSQGAKAPSDVTGQGTAPTQSAYPSDTAMNPQTPSTSATSNESTSTSNESTQTQPTSHELLTGTFACLQSQLGMASSPSSMTTPSSSSSSASSGTTPPSSDTAGSRAFSESGGYSDAPERGAGTSGNSSSMAQGSTAQSSSGTTGLGVTTPGSGRDRCAKVAQAASVSPDGLARGDSSATNGVRRLIQSRLSSEQVSADVSDNTLAFFDKGLAALSEAKIAGQALALRSETSPYGTTSSAKGSSGSGKTGASGKTGSSTSPSGTSSSTSPSGAGKSSTARSNAPSQRGTEDWSTQGSASPDQIRDHKALGELYQFGQNLGMTPMGSEAQALAWVIGVNRFVAVRDLPPSDKPLAAEPLFSAILNVPAPAPTAGRTMPTWNQYLAAAARSVNATSSSGTRTGAVGGGPAPTADEKSNLREVSRAAQDRLQVLAQHLPQSSELRDDINESITELKTFSGPSGSGGSSTTSGSGSNKSSGNTSGSGSSGSSSSGSSTDKNSSGSTPSR